MSGTRVAAALAAGTPDYEYALWRITADGKISVQKGARATVGCFGSFYFGPQGADCTDPTAIRPEDARLCDECDTFYRCQHDWLDPDCPLPDCDHRVFCLDPVKEMADRVYSSGAWAASLEGETRRFRVFVPDDVGRYFRVLDRPWLGPAGKVHFVVGGAYDGTGVDIWDIGVQHGPVGILAPDAALGGDGGGGRGEGPHDSIFYLPAQTFW